MWTMIGHNGRAPSVVGLAARALLLMAASCSAPDARPPPVLDPGKVASVVVGRSSRADVFGALGRPGRMERSGRGETWIYEATQGGTRGGAGMGGVAAAAGVAGAFVPYVGLVGSGLGLAGAAVDGARPEVVQASLAVVFRDDGVVRDCTFSTTALPAGMPGAATDAPVIDCQRPATPTAPPRGASGQ